MNGTNFEIEEKIDAIVNELAAAVIERARRNLAVTRTRTGYRTEAGVTRSYKYKGKVDASGKLSRSLTFNPVKKNGVIEIKFYGKGTQKYADVVEQGRRPNKKRPPTQPIEEWLSVKKIKPRSRSGQFVSSNTQQQKKQIAFLIARKIGKYGTEPIHYFKEAIEAEMEINFPRYEEEIKKYVELKINEGWL